LQSNFPILAGTFLLFMLFAQRSRAQSLTLTISSDPSGISLGGTGTPSASMALGNVQAFGGTVPSGVTKSLNGTSSWTLSSPVDVRVTKSGLVSAAYTLTAQLQSTDSINTWMLGGVTIHAVSASTVTLSGSYGSNAAYVFSLTIPFSAPAEAISNTLNFVATSN
jgi:hypothetical protein